MRKFRLLYIGGAVVMGIAGYLLTARTGLHAQQGGAQVAIGANDIGGSVSSSKGPEAGVWVIAETTDLPTRYIKEVVTDDQGRYLIPDLPKANYTVWARGYGLVDSPKVQTAPGKHVDLQPTRGAGRKGRRALLSGQLLVCNAERSRPRRISRDRPRGQRPSREHQEPSPVFGQAQDRRVRSVPSTGQRIYAHDSGHVQRHGSSAGLAAPLAVRTGRRTDGGRDKPARPQASPGDVCAIGPRGSRTANCPLRRPRGRRASSATW